METSRKTQPAPNSKKPDWQKLGGNTEAQAHFCCFYSQALRSISSSQTQATRTQGRPAFGYSSFLKAPCYMPYTFISKLDTVHNTGSLITLPGKCLSWVKVIFIFQFILALFLVFHDYLLHLITSERKNKNEKIPNAAPKVSTDNTDGHELTIYFF